MHFSALCARTRETNAQNASPWAAFSLHAQTETGITWCTHSLSQQSKLHLFTLLEKRSASLSLSRRALTPSHRFKVSDNLHLSLVLYTHYSKHTYGERLKYAAEHAFFCQRVSAFCLLGCKTSVSLFSRPLVHLAWPQGRFWPISNEDLIKCMCLHRFSQKRGRVRRQLTDDWAISLG